MIDSNVLKVTRTKKGYDCKCPGIIDKIVESRMSPLMKTDT